MLPALLASIGLPMLLKIAQTGLAAIKNPVAQAAAEALSNFQNETDKGNVSGDDLKEANRHIEAMAQIQSAELQTAIAQVNESLRAEVASEDKYVRRMRPTFGYIMAATWGAQMLALAWTILFNPYASGDIINAMSSLSTIWSVGLAVLGVYVYKRSEEKSAKSRATSPMNFFTKPGG